MWGSIFGIIAVGAGYAYSNGRTAKVDEEEDYDLLDPSIDVEPITSNKKKD